ncbi:MAG TPA: bifunctional RNase H/acid phosphatase [Thermopolyspora sp.]
MTAFIVEADGGSRGNPGPAGYGAVVKSADGTTLAEVAEAIGINTNNVAEYSGLIAGLKALMTIAGEGARVEVRMDSKLVIEQMAGRWKIKNETLRGLATQAAGLARRLRVTWKWIPRAQNSHADRLANEAMNAAAEGRTWKSSPFTANAPGMSNAEDTPAERRTREPSSVTTPTTPPRADSPTGAPASQSPTARAWANAPVAAGTGWVPPPSRPATSILLLRHGETPLSVDRRFSGAGDPELTARGTAQAEAAAAMLSREPYRIDVIVSSPLKRAQQTAQAVAARTGLDVIVEDGLRENDFGAWEGHTFAEVRERWPGELTDWLADTSVAPPGGESFEQTARRVQAATARLLDDHPGKVILAVSHVTPIKTMLRFALLAPAAALYRMHLDVACLSVIDFYPDGPAVVRSMNDTSHLR